jgi:hypothetical protein
VSNVARFKNLAKPNASMLLSTLVSLSRYWFEQISGRVETLHEERGVEAYMQALRGFCRTLQARQ